MEQTGSFSYTLSHLHRLECLVRSKIEELGGNQRLTKIVDTLVLDYQ